MNKLYAISDKERELYNLYTRMNINELLDLGETDPVYRIAVFERVGDKGNVKSFAEMSIGGFMPILSSFPDFDSGLDFIESFKPGFRYSKYFEEFKRSHLKITVKGCTTTYTLGKYAYIVHNNKAGYIESELWMYNDKMHNENGPAYIVYYNKGNNLPGGKYKYIEEYALNGSKYREINYFWTAENSISHLKEYDDNGMVTRVTSYYDNGNIDREDTYKNGVVISRKSYYRDGTFIRESKFY